MNFPDLIPEFNILEETHATCQECGIKVPLELQFIQPVFVGDRYIDLCPRCARGIRNLLLKYPAKAMFAGDSANDLYYKFISWEAMQHPT